MYQLIQVLLFFGFSHFLTCAPIENLIGEPVKQLHCDREINKSECSCYFDGEKTQSPNSQKMLFLDDSAFKINCFGQNLPSYATLELMVDMCNSKSPQRRQEFRMEHCLFSNTSFNRMLQISNTTSVRHLYIKYWPNIGDGFTAQQFENFTSVDAMDISHNNITELPATIFNDMPLLKTLIMKNNSIRNFEKQSFVDTHLNNSSQDDNIFSNLRQLKYLSLYQNDLIHLPKNLFSKNRHLAKIELTKFCNHAISTLPPGMFANLTSLYQLRIDENNFTELPDDLLQNCYNLTTLFLGQNSLRTLPSSIFKDTTKMMYLNISYNKFNFFDYRTFHTLKNLLTLDMTNACSPEMATLPSALFANLTSLIRVTLDANHFRELPENLFQNCSKLTIISMTRNAITVLPDRLLKYTIKLKELDFSDNQLESLSSSLFDSLQELQILTLARNRLISDDSLSFIHLSSLTRLDMSGNNLTSIDIFKFGNAAFLTAIDLSDNRLQLELDTRPGLVPSSIPWSPFSNCKKLEILNLRNNSLDGIFFDWKHSTSLKTLDLSFNRFRHLKSKDLIFSPRCDTSFSIDFSNNQIEGIFLNDLENVTESNCEILHHSSCRRNTTMNRFETILNLKNNPITCNCSVYSAAHYLQKKTLSSINIILEHVNCYRPESLRNTSLDFIDLLKLKCSLNSTYPKENEKCPEKCICEYRPADRSIIVNCSDAGMEAFPRQLPNMANFSVELLLANNNLKTLDGLTHLFSTTRVTKLSLSFNKLKNINHLNIPEGLKVLMIDNNEISSLDKKTIQQLNISKALDRLTLHNNPWNCDCKSQHFIEFLQFQNQNKKLRIENYENITCHSNARPIIHIQAEYLCDGLFIKTIPLISLLIFALLIIAILVLYHNYEHEIKVWMFAHKICLCLVTEKELDRNKKYDAFVSFSAKDEHFVVNYLMPLLEENNEHRIKLCIHHRDFVAGEFIPDQIINAVENSRRTIIVLSPNFLESVWTRMEFRVAHLKAIKERCARVVVILLSQVDTEKLDPELKAYITMNTYVKWGDPWFWEKLRYALPHPDAYLKRR